MIYAFRCVACGHVDDKNVNFETRSNPLKCDACGKNEFIYNEALTIQGSRLAYIDSPLAWAEKNNMPTVDMAAGLKGFGRRTAGVHRVVPGLPGHEGGESKKEL